ncbi:MAG: Rieske (2Fe-2S) protein [Caldilineaceae bacterium SB0670_bin_27]|uniref:Rieske (2Fe-2S) protein n=1 Tax=Caldilineaceae bacterium SB0664_bin_27 TaxID=2605260 RepID=A0A6B0YW10_9CHLR|nr:Rieske (2Fe-2S) protein [Caldilineaceae bacterium SB0664_bin_27]MYJ78752.1 Rieske (2Fe-2S) protein [Caldilineaceae bacterium SB0670_bin_27]
MTTEVAAGAFQRIASVAEVTKTGLHTVQVNGHVIVLVHHEDEIYALDNRCPHMGFPLDRGSVHDGILTCHWHHARFDLCTGGSFDLWADDTPNFPVELRNGDVFVDVTPRQDPVEHQRHRLAVGLERNLSLVVAKAAITLVDEAGDTLSPFSAGLEFGARYRMEGWGQGLTMLTCFQNLLPSLGREDRARALAHGLAAVAADSAGSSPRFVVTPLPDGSPDLKTLKQWFRRFILVRDAEGAERCIITALHAGAGPQEMADILFSAATDFRYIDVGHPLDFTNKAFEALDIVGWEQAEAVLTSLVPGYASARRMEESNAWRNPIDLIDLLEDARAQIPAALAEGQAQRGRWTGRADLVPVLLRDDPHAIADALLAALRAGAGEAELAGAVTYAAALRIARFHTSNEFGDWDTALHTFTFANAVHQGLRRLKGYKQPDEYLLLLRGVFDAAMSIYLDRFLNIPAARLPASNGTNGTAPSLPALADLLDQQQQVNEAGNAVGSYLFEGGGAEALRAELGALLLREDRNFHTIQCVETAFRQHELLSAESDSQDEAVLVLVAAARYLAAHAPTMRAQGQTFGIARRLHRNEKLFEGE